jgi:stearoyl-CoA desaturase (delta-9 desaturase)
VGGALFVRFLEKGFALTRKKLASHAIAACGQTPRAAMAAPNGLRKRIVNLAGVILPFAGLVVAIVFLWGRGFSWVDLGVLVGMYCATGLGITVGYHRLFTHRAFETTRVVQFILAALGSMALQGPLLRWVAMHRRHHQLSDTTGDPHSPHHQGSGALGLLRGAWHAHVGWVFNPDPPQLSRYIKDLLHDGQARVMSALFPFWAGVGLLIPGVLGGLLTQSWTGAFFATLWGGLVRIFLVHHVTWSVNSVCHLWGQRPFANADQSRNNLIFGILALGEGWHNNHHAFPTSACHGLRWWQFDASYLLIRLLVALRLAWNVKLPERLALAAARA